jgi:hydroxymethylpyrimidine/phosphomethylpyrimidine kinase
MSIQHKSKDMIQTILVIAGSDPSGGAGIQADLKTMTSIGTLSTAVITCITVQNSFGVTQVAPLSKDLVKNQIIAVLEDHLVTHIKIGMVGNIEIAKEIANTLKSFQGEVIYDPVMSSTTGQQLYNKSTPSQRPDYLLHRTTVLTPNLPELESLTNRNISSPQDTLEGASLLLTEFPGLKAVLVKGGHSEYLNNITDYFVYRDNKKISIEFMEHVRIQTRNSHGTGCSLASAFTAFHSLHGNKVRAFKESVNYINTLMQISANETIIQNNSGYGPLLHFKWKTPNRQI